MNQINSKDDLIRYFTNASKKEKQVKIGVEHEKFLFKEKNKRINFKEVTKIFNSLKKFNWKPVKENNVIIALSKNKKKITLEPGNQIELSGAPLKSIHLNCDESYQFLNELKKICSELNLKMISSSFDPFSKLQDISKNPKSRYKIMDEEMPKDGKLSLEMMYQTTGTQVNLDYTSEKDFTKKFKLMAYLVPISIGIFANSPFKESKLNGYSSYRSKVWQKTSRGGLPISFLEDMTFEKYVDISINLPLLFIYKNSIYRKGEGYTFKDFMKGKIKSLNKAKPNITDFENHLGTMFNEIRLKKYIEIRSLDTCEWNCHCAGPAFYTGLAYGALNESHDIIKKWKTSDVLNAYLEAPKKGLNTIIGNKTLLEWGKIFLNLSKKGLKKRAIKNKNGDDESIFLESVEKILLNEKTKADLLTLRFKEEKNLEFLYEKK